MRKKSITLRGWFHCMFKLHEKTKLPSTTKHVFYFNAHFTTCLLLLWRVIGGMHEIQCCSFHVRVYFKDSWCWCGTTIQLETHVSMCLGTPNETCIIVGSEEVDLDRLSSQIIICFKDLGWVLAKKGHLFL